MVNHDTLAIERKRMKNKELFAKDDKRNSGDRHTISRRETANDRDCPHFSGQGDRLRQLLKDFGFCGSVHGPDARCNQSSRPGHVRHFGVSARMWIRTVIPRPHQPVLGFSRRDARWRRQTDHCGMAVGSGATAIRTDMTRRRGRDGGRSKPEFPRVRSARRDCATVLGRVPHPEASAPAA
jgi:hypothetical protein